MGVQARASLPSVSSPLSPLQTPLPLRSPPSRCVLLPGLLPLSLLLPLTLVQVRVFLSYWGNPHAPHANESLGTRHVRVMLRHARGAAPTAAALAVVGPGTTDPRAACGQQRQKCLGSPHPARPPPPLRRPTRSLGATLPPGSERSTLAGGILKRGWVALRCPPEVAEVSPPLAVQVGSDGLARRAQRRTARRPRTRRPGGC